MIKEGDIIEMIGAVAVQATQQVLDVEDRLTARIDEVETNLTAKIDDVEVRLSARIEAIDLRLTDVEQRLTTEMQLFRNDNLNFHDEIVGYLKRAEQIAELRFAQ